MIIANPIYDVVFKRMMENERVARFFIGTLLEENIETVELRPQELTYTDERSALSVFRLDFVATIKTEGGEYKKVLIEIQKARNHIDLMRFRNYLAEQYKKEDVVNDKKAILPITTIYILGFKLPEIETPCIKVERNYRDRVNKTILPVKSDFVEKLTHDSFIVQVQRITDRYQTSLDKLLSVFEQRNFVDDQKIIKEFNHTADLEELKIITDILHHAGTNPSEKKRIETEKEAWRTVNAMFEEEREAFEEEREAFEEEREDFLKVLKEKNQAISEKDQALSEKEQALSEKDKLIAELLRKLDEKK